MLLLAQEQAVRLNSLSAGIEPAQPSSGSPLEVQLAGVAVVTCLRDDLPRQVEPLSRLSDPLALRVDRSGGKPLGARPSLA